MLSWHFLDLFSLWIVPSLPPLPSLYFSPMYQCDRCLVSLAWGLTAGRRGFTSHGGITLSWRLALPIVEGPGHPGHPAPLSYAVVD